jgi:hypothetical protein
MGLASGRRAFVAESRGGIGTSTLVTDAAAIWQGRRSTGPVALLNGLTHALKKCLA